MAKRLLRTEKRPKRNGYLSSINLITWRKLMALTSFFSALTGLNSSSHTINVIGDNLANMNTIGFKAGKATFAEIIGGMSGFSATGNPMVFGQGSMLNGIVHKQMQGTPEYTGNSTDAMINGKGLFVVATGDGGIGYTRGGRFQFDGTGNLVSSDGYQLMGYMAGADGKIDTTNLTTIDVRMGQFIPAVASSTIVAAVNLDSQAPVYVPANPEAGSEFSTSVQIYDSLGAQHTIKLTYQKVSAPGSATPQWNLKAELMVDGAATNPVINVNGLAAFQLNFDSSGNLAAAMPGELKLDLSGAGMPATLAAGGPVTLNLRDDQGRSLTTSAASASGASYTAQNGYAPSTLASVQFDNEGRVIGIAANGNYIVLGQLAIATFPNIEGLQKYNGSTLIASGNAGEPSIGTAGSGGRGMVAGGSLEMSNVDMAEEFINLIIAQRAFQANARVITTSDELYQEAIHLKR
jgi:flagellar hook protein FlgE